ncbi:MCE family protein [Mycobacterium sp.]|uniref:MCE family protein n=1 Tax=Mycobacterium sp. TaxID=1785 RepID=UPI003A8972DE
MKRRAITLAAIVLPVLAAVGTGWWYLAGRQAPMTVTAQFDSASGLYEGNTVAVLGMPVGSVTRITPKGSYVEVRFTVDRSVKVPADVQAVTISTSILTDRQIELTPPYRGGPVLPDNATIGLTRTKTPVEFTRVLAVLDKITKSLEGNGHGGGPLADVIDGGAAVTNGNGAKIKGALNELSNALRLSSDGGQQTSTQLTAIIKNLSSLFEAAAANDSKLRDFTSTLHQLSGLLADEDIGSGSTGRQLSELVRRAGDLLDANRDAIKDTLAQTNPLLQTVVDHQRDLTEILDVTPMLADNVYNVVDRENGALRAHFLTDRMIFDSQLTKEVCNLMGLRQLGCSTGTVQDFGPDFGLTYVLDGLAAMGQK